MTPDERAAYQANERVKLLRARHAIEKILRENDLVASVFMGGMYGQFESVLTLDATWSNLSLEAVGGRHGLRLRSKAADCPDDFIRHRNLESSVSVVNAFAEGLTSNGLAFMQAAEKVNAATDAEDGPLEPAHTKQ